MTVDRYADLVDVGDVGCCGEYCSAGGIRIEGVASRRGNLHSRRIANYYRRAINDSRIVARCAVVVRYRDIYGVVALCKGDIANRDGIISKTKVANRLSVDGYANLTNACDIRRSRQYRCAGGIRVERVARRRGNLYSRRIAIDYRCAINNSRVIARCAVVVRYNDIYAVVALL